MDYLASRNEAPKKNTKKLPNPKKYRRHPSQTKKTEWNGENKNDIDILADDPLVHDFGAKHTIFTKIKTNPSDRSKKFDPDQKNEKNSHLPSKCKSIKNQQIPLCSKNPKSRNHEKGAEKENDRKFIKRTQKVMKKNIFWKQFLDFLSSIPGRMAWSRDADGILKTWKTIIKTPEFRISSWSEES